LLLRPEGQMPEPSSDATFNGLCVARSNGDTSLVDMGTLRDDAGHDYRPRRNSTRHQDQAESTLRKSRCSTLLIAWLWAPHDDARTSPRFA
jgi:hypothetical protein